MTEHQAEALGKIIGKIAGATFIGWLIVNFKLPLWAAVLLILCV